MDRALVKIGDYSYSLVEPPPVSSPVVIKAKEDILGHIDLSALVDDLGKLGNCVRIAYHGVAGHTELQIKIQRIGYDVTKLCDKSAITVAHFKKASGTVTLALQATYEYLLDSLEDMAIETLADVADTARGMAEAAESLNVEFDQQSKVVINALEEVQRTHGTEETKKKEMEKQRQDMEANIAKRKEIHKQAQELAASSEQLFYDAKRQEEEALQQPDEVEDVEYKVVEYFWGLYSSVEKKVTSRPTHWRETAQAARQDKLRYLDKMQEQQKIRSNALIQLAKFSKTLENIKTSESQIQASVEALVAAVGALRSLAAVMLQAAQFWKQMQQHCEELASDKMKREIERTLKIPEERRLKVWTSNAFKLKAINYFAGWVALDGVCTVYVERIKLTRRLLYSYIQEALSTEDARKRVVELAHEFGASLKEEQDAIEKLTKKQERERDALQKNETQTEGQ